MPNPALAQNLWCAAGERGMLLKYEAPQPVRGGALRA